MKIITKKINAEVKYSPIMNLAQSDGIHVFHFLWPEDLVWPDLNTLDPGDPA